MHRLSDVPASTAEGTGISTARMSDGTLLHQRTWAASGAARGSLLLVHGLGEHCGRYEHVARVLNAAGITVRCYDQRGFGGSGGQRATIPHDNALVDDAAEMFARLAREASARGETEPPFILGHSMGGCVVARAVTGGWIAPRGMILSSPALAPRLSALDRLATRVGMRLAPDMRVPHRLPLHHLSHDPAVLKALATDPLVHDRVTPRLVSFMLAAGRQAIADAPRCRVPTLLLVSGDDRLVRREGAIAFHAALPDGVGELHLYDALYHEVFNEVENDRAQVFSDLAGWLERRLPARS
jgi:alpha-beta hydrolase superfamily lysophospholipase